MAVRDAVRDAQRRLAALDGAYTRAVTNLERSCARRAEVLAEHDSLVAVAQGEVDRTVVAMAVEVGADLTATLLRLDAAYVRHLAKARKGSTA
jgi:predicted RNase H-like nuclease